MHLYSSLYTTSYVFFLLKNVLYKESLIQSTISYRIGIVIINKKEKLSYHNIPTKLAGLDLTLNI